jgi:opacity protein-like surface antigen
MQAKHDGRSLGESETKPGVTIGGGVEYFFQRSVSAKAELRYHGILRTLEGLDPPGLVVIGGLKPYF